MRFRPKAFTFTRAWALEGTGLGVWGFGGLGVDVEGAGWADAAFYV
jgi:hypothetical protein